MPDKLLQELNNTRTAIVPGDQLEIGGADGESYRASLTVLQDYLLEASLTTSTIKAPQSAVVKTAIDAINTILTTDNASFDDFQKITDAIEAIQATLSVDDAAYDTLQKITDKLKTAETKLATIDDGAEVNVQANWNESDNTNDAFIKNKPSLGTASSKNVGTDAGNLQENGAILGNSQTVETDGTGKFITVAKNTAYNANFGTGNTDVARGDASYLKAETYTQTEVDSALTNNSTDDRARANHTGEQSIATVTGLQTALDSKENIANKGVANGYASLNGSGEVPASQLPSYVDDVVEYANLASFPATGESGKVYVALDTNLTYRWSGSTYVKLNDVDLTDYLNKTTDTLDDVNAGTTNKHFTATLETKLNGIEDNATADQTAAEIKTEYESNADTNAFTDAEKAVVGNTSGTNTGDETTASIQTKRPLKTIEGQSLEGSGDIDLTKSDVGLANVDNTSDADKPVSTAQQTALDGKLAKASNFSDVNNRQTALDNLTDAANATNEYILTKDTTTGNARWKVAPGSAASGVPVGAVMYFYDAVPTGFFELNGSTFDQTLYPILYAANGNSNQLQDFRGYFIRAFGTNISGVASGSLLAYQGDATAKNGLRASRLRTVTRSGTDVNSNSATVPADGTSNAIESGANDRYTFTNDIRTDSVSSTDTETRPHNIALYIAIKHD